MAIQPQNYALSLVPDALAGPLDEQPLEAQVAYLKQVVAMQQHMLTSQALAEQALQLQNRQLQLISTEVYMQANDHIRQLKKTLDQQILKEQKSLLTVEHSAIKSQIVQMKTLHETSWKGCVESTSRKLGLVASKIQILLNELEAICEKFKPCHTWYSKVYPKEGSQRTLNVTNFSKYLSERPSLSLQEICNGRDKYDIAHKYFTDIKNDCLSFVDKLDMKTLNTTHLAHHPAYKDISLPNLFEEHSIEALDAVPLDQLDEDTIQQMTSKNANLKNFMVEQQNSHLNACKALSLLARTYHLEPCLNNIQYYFQRFSDGSKTLTKALSMNEYATQKKRIQICIEIMDLAKMHLGSMHTDILALHDSKEIG